MIRKGIKTLAFLALCFLVSSCEPSRSWAIQINATYTYYVNGKKEIESLYIEKENERFKWSIEVEDGDDMTHYFNFYFSGGDISYDNSEEFTYLASDEEPVEFKATDSSSYYTFVGSKTIYISYAHACKEIKDVIASDRYHIEVSGIHWFCEPDIINRNSKN